MKEIENAKEVEFLKQIRISKKIYNKLMKLKAFQQHEALLEAISDKEKHIGERAVISWLDELANLKESK